MKTFKKVESALTRVDRVGSDTYLLAVSDSDLANLTAPGQFFMLRGWGDLHPLLSRPFSICDVKGSELLFLVRIFGSGSKCLASRSPGDSISLMGPLGKEFEVSSSCSSYILVAGGIGLAPFPLLAKLLRSEQPDCEITLIYGEKTASMIVDPRKLIELEFESIITTDDGSMGVEGTVVESLAEKLETGIDSKIFACGPRPMLRAIQNHPICRDRDLLFFMEELMACGFGTCMGCVVELTDGEETSYARVCREGPVFDGKMVIL
jgi:dihydroorotate dehydrogenase electron transfer subunit